MASKGNYIKAASSIFPGEIFEKTRNETKYSTTKQGTHKINIKIMEVTINNKPINHL